MRGICGGIAFFLFMLLAACADGLMEAYGMKVTVLVSLAVIAVSAILVEISNSPERRQ